VPEARRRICLVTTGQPASNPRLVKEADALVAAGHDVHVIGAFAGQWAVDAEPTVMATRSWTLEVVDWRREASPWLYWRSRVRQHVAKRIMAGPAWPPSMADHAVTRPSRELRIRTSRHAADLYIAHNLGALPAAAHAAKRHRARLGFDAEDFHSGQLPARGDDALRKATVQVERRYLPRCDYVTASAPAIGEAYRPLVRASKGPTVVLNVASLSERPERSERPDASRNSASLRLYWFSQTIGPGRGLEDAVRAMGMVTAPIELHLRGTWAAGYEVALRELARQCGVPADRIAAEPPAPPGEMVAIASAFDVGLALEPGNTVNSEILVSNKVFTYLMAGIPMLASRTSGQAWLLDQAPGTGWTYHPGSAIELADVLRRLVTEPALIQTGRTAARRASETRFCWEIEQRRFLDTVAAVLEATEPGTSLHPGSVATVSTGSAR